MSLSPTEKLAAKKHTWLARTQAVAAQLSSPEVEALLALPRTQSLRINTLKGTEEQTLATLVALGWQGKPYAWAPHT